MRIWCIKIGTVYYLYYGPWVEVSAGGLLLPEGLYSPVAMYYVTSLKSDMYLIAVVKLEIHIKIKDYLPQA